MFLFITFLILPLQKVFYWEPLYLRQMQRTIELVGEVHEESLSPHTRGRLLDAFADWKRSTR